MKQPNCESCGEPASGYTLDDVPLCKSCGIISEANTTEEELERLKKEYPGRFK